MLERLALMQLHNALRGEVGSERESWRKDVETLGFGNTLLPDPTLLPIGPGALGPEFVAALKRLAGPSDPDLGGDQPRSDEVAPIEKLDVLIRLLKGRVNSLTAEERTAVEDVAKTLLEPEFRDDSEQIDMLLQAIDQVGPDRQVIRTPDLEGDKTLGRIPGPRAPRAGSTDTVRDVLAAPEALRLSTTLADHPVVDVDACIYKAMIGTEAEYPVHLRTTIRWDATNLQLGNFDHLLEPEKWPKYNSFWAAMKPVPVKAPLLGAQAGELTAEETAEQEVTGEAGPYVTHMTGIGWESLGTYHERVGFDDGSVGAGQVDTRDLYPETYLYFSRQERRGSRAPDVHPDTPWGCPTVCR